MAILTGSIPLTRIPAGPSSPARVFTTPASPGNSPLEMATPASGTRTEEASTKTIEPPVPVSEPPAVPPIAVAAQIGGENPGEPDGAEEDASNADRHASSAVVATVPGGDPPTLISAPSRRPKRSLAAAISRSGVAGSALSATTQARASAAASCARRVRPMTPSPARAER